jgi:hypothetical protein
MEFSELLDQLEVPNKLLVIPFDKFKDPVTVKLPLKIADPV